MKVNYYNYRDDTIINTRSNLRKKHLLESNPKSKSAESTKNCPAVRLKPRISINEPLLTGNSNTVLSEINHSTSERASDNKCF